MPQETHRATAAPCCTGHEHVLCDGSGMKPVRYWSVHQEKCILGVTPYKGCYHPACPSLMGSFSMSHSALSAVHFIQSPLHLVGIIQSGLDWTCVSRDQQSLADEVGDVSKPVAPSPTSSFLFGLQPSHCYLYRVLSDRNTLCLSPIPGKQNSMHPPGDLFSHSSLQASTLMSGLAFSPFCLSFPSHSL